MVKRYIWCKAYREGWMCFLLKEKQLMFGKLKASLTICGNTGAWFMPHREIQLPNSIKFIKGR